MVANVKEKLIQWQVWLLGAASARETLKALDATAASQDTGIYNLQILMVVKVRNIIFERFSVGYNRKLRNQNLLTVFTN